MHEVLLDRQLEDAQHAGLSLVVGIAGAVESFCGPAFGAGQYALLGIVLQRALLINLAVSAPPILLWFLARDRLLWWADDRGMAAAAR